MTIYCYPVSDMPRSEAADYLRFAGFSDEEDDLDDDLPESLDLDELLT